MRIGGMKEDHGDLNSRNIWYPEVSFCEEVANEDAPRDKEMHREEECERWRSPVHGQANKDMTFLGEAGDKCSEKQAGEGGNEEVQACCSQLIFRIVLGASILIS